MAFFPALRDGFHTRFPVIEISRILRFWLDNFLPTFALATLESDNATAIGARQPVATAEKAARMVTLLTFLS